MAQHPFAEKARQVLESNGVKVNPDGSTTRVFVDNTQQTNTVNTDQSSNDTPTQDKPSTNEGSGVDEKDRLIEMQRQELEQLRQQKTSWEQQKTTNSKSDREVELEKELNELKEKISSQTKQQQADEFRSLLEKNDFNGENIDDDMLLEIRDKLLLPTANKLLSLEERLVSMEERTREPTAVELVEKNKQKAQVKIKDEIVDFDTIFNSKAFQDKLAKKDDRFPTSTYGETLQLAYESGDADFIIREIKSFMGDNKAQTVENIADVGATNGVGTTVESNEDKNGYTYTQDEAIEMLRKVQFGAITRQQYSEYRSKLDAHRSSSNK